jgi:type IV pilus assembly protein PilC
LNKEFSYEAKTRDGQVLAGHVRAHSRSGAARALKEQDLFIIGVRPAEAAAPAVHAPMRAGSNEVAWTMWQLSMMVETGMLLSDSLACLTQQAKSASLRALLGDVEKRVRNGSSLSTAMEAHSKSFPSSLTALVRASEAGGALKDVLRKAAQYLVNDGRSVRRIKGALVYPAVMLVICMAVTVFLLTVILPKFAVIFDSRHAALPWPTRFLMSVSDNLIAHWFLWLAGLAIVVAGFVVWSRSSQGRREIDHFVVSIPVAATVFNALYQARSYAAIAIMLESRVPILDAVRIAQSVTSNAEYRALWRDVEDQIRVGERMSVPLFRAAFIPDSVAQVIDNGDRNGRLGKVFSHLAEFFEEEYSRALATTMQLIEPCLILLMGSIVGFVAVALMMPLVQASRIVSQ